MEDRLGSYRLGNIDGYFISDPEDPDRVYFKRESGRMVRSFTAAELLISMQAGSLRPRDPGTP